MLLSQTFGEFDLVFVKKEKSNMKTSTENFFTIFLYFIDQMINQLINNNGTSNENENNREYIGP